MAIFKNIINKVFGSKSEKDLKAIRPIVEEINVEFRKLKNISDEELEIRRKNWKTPPLKAQKGSLYKYANVVSSASKGCVTDEF